MPQLNILHHKSYHPYLEKNKQRVREDEAKAAAEELAREQARIDASSASRLDELRRRAGSPSLNRPDDEADNLPSTSSSRQGGTAESLIDRHRKEKARHEKREKKQKERLDFEWPAETARREARRAERRREEGLDDRRHDRDVLSRAEGEVGDADASAVWMENGHINLFADVEKEQSKAPPTMADIAKKKKEQEADQYTVYLSRPDKETKPWYSDRNLKRYEELEIGEDAEARRERDKRKDARSKNRHDPLTQITTLLPKHGSQPSRKPAAASSLPVRSAAESRLSRETSERARALALIAKTKADRERAKSGGSNRWDDTPMSAGHGGHSWADDFERDKERAGMRFHNDDRRSKVGTRGWDR